LPELGNLVNQGIDFVVQAPWLIIFPGLTILLITFGFSLLGDGIRDIMDPRIRR
jgi:peptide/nickel transport system permease protein